MTHSPDSRTSLFAIPVQFAFGAIAASPFVLFPFAHGGFAETVWLPAGLYLLALLGLLVVVRPELLQGLARPAVGAIALLSAFTAWSFLTIVWAEAAGDAWSGANRTLLYLIVFVLFAVWPWRAFGAATVLGAIVGAAIASSLEALYSAGRADKPFEYFFGSRFSEPMGYHNATAALLGLVFWPALFFASRRETNPVARACSLSAATVALEVAVVPQSRAWLVAMPAALLVYLAIVPRRLRSLLFLLPPAVAVALSLETLLDVFHDAGGGEPVDALRSAFAVIAVSALATFAVGLVAALLDRRLAPPPRVTRIAGRVVAGAAVATVVAGLGVIAIADPVARLSSTWEEFKAGEPATPRRSHFESVGSNRYDVWRVALDEFRDEPIRGIGPDNFAIPYLRDRQSDDEPRFPHSVELQVLSQTGVPGALLFLGFLACAVVAATRARARPGHWPLAAVALVTFAYWFVHGSVDWFWEVPGLAGPAFGCLGLAAGLARTSVPGRSPRLLLRLAIGFAALAAAVSLGATYLAAKHIEAALGSWKTDSEAAYDRLELARQLNPLSERPDLIAGLIASKHRDWPRMRAAFTRALGRNPSSWYAELELAVAEANAGTRGKALEHLGRAESLNPREPVVDLVRDRVAEGRRVPPEFVDRLLLERLDERGF